MTNFEFGQVVLVRFPFTDQRSSKQRPAIVISGDDYNQYKPDIILMVITSQVGKNQALQKQPYRTGKRPDYSNLLRSNPSSLTAEKAIVKKSLGILSSQDQQSLQNIIQQIITTHDK